MPSNTFASQPDPDTPQISLMGEVDTEMFKLLQKQLHEVVNGESNVTVEISTSGGDAEAARRMALEVELARKRLHPRRLFFLGKTNVYSAGVTIMAGFPRIDRFLTRDAMLLIHCRQLEKSLEISGPLRASRPKLEALLHEIETGIDLETQNFNQLIAGSDVSIDELLERALYNWYVPAGEALERGLIAGVLPSN